MNAREGGHHDANVSGTPSHGASERNGDDVAHTSTGDAAMHGPRAAGQAERTPINPVSWSQQLGFDQGLMVSGGSRTLYCAGQTATGSDGSPLHPDDMAGQLGLALDNLEAVLAGADMSLANLVRLNVHSTDVDLLFSHYGVLAGRLGAARVAPPTTMLGVSRLAIPGLLVELEGTAVG